MKSDYELLEIEPNADITTIKKAFHRLAKRFHPDISHNQQKFLTILAAYKSILQKKNKKDERSSNDLTFSTKKKSSVLPKNRVEFALSLADIARLGIFNRAKVRRRMGFYNPKGYDVMVWVTEEELKRGAQVVIDVPARVVCPLCRGSKTFCTLCSGTGQIVKAVPIPVTLPRNIGDNTVLTISLKSIKYKEYAFFLIRQLLIKIKYIKG